MYDANAYFGKQFVAQAAPEVRLDFLRKTYSTLFTSLLVTVGAGFIASRPDMLPVTSGLMFPLLIVGLIVGIVMSFTARTPGLNIAMLGLYSLIQGAILGPLLTMLEKFAPGIPMQAAILTIAVFGGLTMYTLTTGKDFQFLGGMLFAGVIGLLVVGLLLMFFHSPLLSVLYAAAGVVIFSGFVLYDTSEVMKRVGPNDTTAAAISLYVDFMGLFYMILRLLMELNGGSRRSD